MPKLILMRGLPGSGKTTWARDWMTYRSNCPTIRINRDDLRASMFGQYTIDHEEFVKRVSMSIAREAFERNYDVIIDDTNLPETTIERWRDFVHAQHRCITVEYIDLRSVPLETCLDRNSKRDKPVPESAIRNMYKQYVEGKV